MAVEGTLWRSMLTLIGGALLAGALAIWFAFVFGRRIASPISALAVLARHIVDAIVGGLAAARHIRGRKCCKRV